MTKKHKGRTARSRPAESTLEFAVFVFIVIMALLSMAVYGKRAFQGRYREAADELGGQYDPAYTKSDITITSTSDLITATTTKQVMGNQLETTSEQESEETSRRKGWEKVEPNVDFTRYF